MKIGILGGTFNPIHIGHLILAEQAQYELGLDNILFIPSYIPPHKRLEDNISAKDRLNMVKLAIEDNQKFNVSTIEIKRKGKSYTVITLRQLKDKYPQDELYFLAGADSLQQNWKGFSEVLDLSNFIVVNRPGWSTKGKLDERMRLLEIPTVVISSSEIRKMVKEGKPIRYLVPDKVREYISNNSLYNNL